jgi:hypothetical protein
VQRWPETGVVEPVGPMSCVLAVTVSASRFKIVGRFGEPWPHSRLGSHRAISCSCVAAEGRLSGAELPEQRACRQVFRRVDPLR